MTEQVKITALEAERFKRLKALTLEPTPDGLTVIGGKNRQGKTTALESIMFALGGDRFRPSEVHNRDEKKAAKIRLELSNGIIVERSGKNASLKVTAPEGLKGNQTLLNTFLEPLALDLPKFMEASPKKKAEILLQIIGAGEELANLEGLIAEAYEERRLSGRIADDAEAKVSGGIPYPDAPSGLVSIGDLVERIEAADQQRKNLEELHRYRDDEVQTIEDLEAKVVELQEALAAHRKRLARFETAIGEAVVPEDTEELKATLATAEETNGHVAANKEHGRKVIDAETKRAEHTALDTKLERLRSDRDKFLDGVNMPLKGLTVVDGELVYKGDEWDCMSGSDQLRVAASIVKELKPECGFVLLDKLEQMDLDTLSEFGAWAKGEGLQIIATRVSTGEECSIVIEDGEVTS